MSTAPLTITGQRPPINDVLASRLVSKLVDLKAASDISGLEIEGRVGILVNKSGDRLRLPILSETCLAPSCHDSLAYEFQADVGERAFEAIKAHLFSIHKGTIKISDNKFPVFKISGLTESHTVDEFYNDQGMRVRVTSRADSPSEVLEVICKQRLSILDVYSGSPDESAFDLRLSINDERKIQNFMRDSARMTGKREKKRWSFESKGFVVDLTQVKSRDRSGDRTLYEVEVELKTGLIVEQLTRMNMGKSHFLYELVTDFIYAVRDLAWGFGQPGVAKVGGVVHDMARTRHPEELVRKYLKVVGGTQPILGDYLYRISDELKGVDSNAH